MLRCGVPNHIWLGVQLPCTSQFDPNRPPMPSPVQRLVSERSRHPNRLLTGKTSAFPAIRDLVFERLHFGALPPFDLLIEKSGSGNLSGSLPKNATHPIDPNSPVAGLKSRRSFRLLNATVEGSDLSTMPSAKTNLADLLQITSTTHFKGKQLLA